MSTPVRASGDSTTKCSAYTVLKAGNEVFGGPDTDRKFIVQAARMEIDAATAADICAAVDGFYINYHTRDFPGGAIRGQLVDV